MMQSARIVGKVQFRQGDGPNIAIRPGPVDVETTATDATLSWAEGPARGAATIPMADYRRYLAEGAIRLQ